MSSLPALQVPDLRNIFNKQAAKPYQKTLWKNLGKSNILEEIHAFSVYDCLQQGGAYPSEERNI